MLESELTLRDAFGDPPQIGDGTVVPPLTGSTHLCMSAISSASRWTLLSLVLLSGCTGCIGSRSPPPDMATCPGLCHSRVEDWIEDKRPSLLQISLFRSRLG